ncbi:PTS system mannitol-specific IIA component/phosphocarrier protein FPr [Anaerospora hongkongensis]|uniref:Mannitol-specific phosphotransferase enzyme IIA component n=1 Tax=Anaerospora hongkongensis TaxID=244830 RepID=A0A4R1Q144_9FIRM|nr:PTS sugar transporter subunit IIA [Anaerospora hongkongensis]TCL39278.1 PTS system mannitol-specific IIA component/phosphocarrier protein FPr [Anaerospora hongkongensis]
MKFDRKLVFIRNDFLNKTEVIEFLGGQLVQTGAVQPDYVQAMHKREQDIGTYITEGVAIPHGTEASRRLVKKAAIVVVKIPRGIEWSDGNKVYLAFGIAGSEEEHVGLLGELAAILMDADQKQQLMAAESEDELFTCLTNNSGKY